MTEQLEDRPTVDRSYMDMAAVWARRSKAKRKKVGALIVKDKRIIGDGYNGLPPGMEGACEIDEHTTDPRVIHAEMNAIGKLAMSESGGGAEGSTLYVTMSPCTNCVSAILAARIKRVVFEEKYRVIDGINTLIECGVMVEQIHEDGTTTVQSLV